MKLRRGLLMAWVIPQTFLLLLDIALFIYIMIKFNDLVQANELDGWMLRWLLLTVAWIFGTYRIYQWYKQGKFHKTDDTADQGANIQK